MKWAERKNYLKKLDDSKVKNINDLQLLKIPTGSELKKVQYIRVGNIALYLQKSIKLGFYI